MRKRAVLGGVVYLALACALIAYELHIRIDDAGHSEFAGMLSAVATMPSSILLFFLTPRVFGVRAGDSNAAFVAVFGAAALLNAVALFLLLNRTKHPAP